MLLSVVIPVYNEEACIDAYFNKVNESAKKASKNSFEIIYVNDGSSDDTAKLISEITRKHKNVRLVSLSRNFGKEIATTAGISFAKGEATIIIDGDGQHPPELMKELVETWKKGADTVVGVRSNYSESGLIKKFGSRLFYFLFNKSSDFKLVPGSTDYRLIDKEVRASFLKFSERNRITRGLIDWLGYQKEYIYFESRPRIAGEATYKISKLIKLAMNSYISLTLVPLYFSGYAGVFITFSALVLGIFVLIEQIILNDPLHLKFTGTAMIGLLIMFLVGIILISQGLLAMYLSHIHTQTQERPLFIVDKRRSVNL